MLTIGQDVLDTLVADFELREASDLFFCGSTSSHLPSHAISVHSKAARNDYSDLLKMAKIDSRRGPGIIYALQKADTEALCLALQRGGMKADYMHGGRTESDKKWVRGQWLNNQLDVVVATEAFGLGVDKSGIAFVHHADPPLNMLCLQQHLGRARATNRQEAQCSCAIFWHEKDHGTARAILRLKVMGGSTADETKRARDLCRVYRFLLDGTAGCLRRQVIMASVPDPEQLGDDGISSCKCCTNCLQVRPSTLPPNFFATLKTMVDNGRLVHGISYDQCYAILAEACVPRPIASKLLFIGVTFGLLREERRGHTTTIWEGPYAKHGSAQFQIFLHQPAPASVTAAAVMMTKQPTVGSTPMSTASLRQAIDNEEEVEAIIRSRDRQGKREYLVSWTDNTADATWIPAVNLSCVRKPPNFNKSRVMDQQHILLRKSAGWSC